MKFLILNILYIFLPFCFAYIHNHLNKTKSEYLRLSFSYFIFINVFLKGVPIGVAALSQGKEMAMQNHWCFSPMYAQYGIAIMSIGMLGLFSIFANSGFRIATAITFALFSLFAAILHIVQSINGMHLYSHNAITLITFDLLTAIILFYFCTNPKSRGKL